MTIRTSPASAVAPVSSRLLSPCGEDVLDLDWDLYLRYAMTARIIDRLLAGATLPVRVLEVGCNLHNVLPRFLDPELVQITRCDVEPYGEGPDFFLIPRQPPWPVGDEAYDAVVALEVLEHLPADQRRGFVAECLRIARHGVVLTAPNGTPEVASAETVGGESYRLRHGRPHPFLWEHQENGLPTEEEVRTILRALDVPHAVFDNAPLDVWLPMLLLSENLKERNPASELQRRLNAHYRDGRVPAGPACYRKIYVAARTFEATAALEPFESLPPAASEAPSSEVAPLHHMATLASATICDLIEDRNRLAEEHVRQVEEHQQELSDCRLRLAEYQAEVTALLEDHRTDLSTLRAQFENCEASRDDFRQQVIVLRSFVQSLRGSRAWGLLAPLRAARRLLGSRGFDASALLPRRHLEPIADGEPGEWVAIGPEPSFVAPCVLPAGWLSIRLAMTSEVPGKLAIYAEEGNGQSECLQRVAVGGRVESSFHVWLDKPALALRLDPLDAAGRFRIENLEVRPLSPLASLLRGRPAAGTSGLPVPAAVEEVADDRAGASGLESTDRAPTGRGLNIVYVLRTAGLCGGVKVVLEHVSRLRERGHNAVVYCLDGSTSWFPRQVPFRCFRSIPAMKEALARFRGIKVATWHETAPWVSESLQAGDRGYYLVQDIEESYCDTPEVAQSALDTYGLGLKPLTEGTWVRDQLQERFGLPSAFVSIGLDHNQFHPRPGVRDPNRILTQARTWSGGGAAGMRLKGWPTARDAVLRCLQLNPRTALTTFSMEERQSLPAELLHVHLRLPSDEKLAQLYSRAGLYLLTSTHEGFGLTAAEAMACGCPVVATRAQGNEEFCIDGATALLADVGDVERLAQQCYRIQTDPILANELSQNGRRFILDYTWDRVIDRLEREFLESDGPEIAIGRTRPVASKPADAEYPDLRLGSEAAVDWSFIIPTVNDVSLVVQCITTCRRHAGADASLEFIVVDDGTRDTAVLERLQEAASDVGFTLLLNHQNLGFSATVNHGLRHARGRCVVLCNNDVEFFQPWLAPLQEAFANPEVGIVGGKLLYPDGAIQHAGMDKVPGQLRWVHSHGKLPGDHPPANVDRPVWSVTGALLAIRRETLRQLGGLSTAYSTAYEDVDYCLHAWQHGVRVAYCSTLAAYHLEGGTRGATPGQKEARPLLWAERERAGCRYFEKKWEALRYIENLEDLLPCSLKQNRQHARGVAALATAP